MHKLSVGYTASPVCPVSWTWRVILTQSGSLWFPDMRRLKVPLVLFFACEWNQTQGQRLNQSADSAGSAGVTLPELRDLCGGTRLLLLKWVKSDPFKTVPDASINHSLALVQASAAQDYTSSFTTNSLSTTVMRGRDSDWLEVDEKAASQNILQQSNSQPLEKRFNL